MVDTTAEVPAQGPQTETEVINTRPLISTSDCSSGFVVSVACFAVAGDLNITVDNSQTREAEIVRPAVIEFKSDYAKSVFRDDVLSFVPSDVFLSPRVPLLYHDDEPPDPGVSHIMLKEQEMAVSE